MAAREGWPGLLTASTCSSKGRSEPVSMTTGSGPVGWARAMGRDHRRSLLVSLLHPGDDQGFHVPHPLCPVSLPSPGSTEPLK